MCQVHYLYYGCVFKCYKNHWRNVVRWSVYAKGADCLRLPLPFTQKLSFSIAQYSNCENCK